MPLKRSKNAAESSTTFSIKNKDIRSRHNIAQRTALSKKKREDRFARRKDEERDPELKRQRLATNIPQTLETKRVFDERIWQPSDDLLNKADVPATTTNDDDDENLERQALAEKDEAAANAELLSLFPTTDGTKAPKCLLTTTKNAKSYSTFETLTSIFPNTTYVPRGTKFSIPEIAKFASNRDYTHVILAVEDNKKVHGLTFIVLPSGPTFHFSLTSWQNDRSIEGKGRNTSHIPELILNNFVTPLGRLTAGMFQSVYPALPDFKGRQVVTLHNQRDYVFFRRHRYVFKEKQGTEGGKGDKTTGAERLGGVKAGEDLGVRVGLQELGPRFTLKLRRVERGVCEGIEWEWKGGMEKDRRKFQL